MLRDLREEASNLLTHTEKSKPLHLLVHAFFIAYWNLIVWRAILTKVIINVWLWLNELNPSFWNLTCLLFFSPDFLLFYHKSQLHIIHVKSLFYGKIMRNLASSPAQLKTNYPVLICFSWLPHIPSSFYFGINCWYDCLQTRSDIKIKYAERISATLSSQDSSNNYGRNRVHW